MMKNKRMLLLMALSGALFPTEGLLAQSSKNLHRTRSSSVGHIGDKPSSIGDTDSETILKTPDWRPASFRTNAVDPTIPSSPLPMDAAYYDEGTGMGMAEGASASSGNVMDSSYGMEGGFCGNASYGSDCMGPSNPGYWLELESLLWFSGERNTPPLVTQSPQGTLPLPGTILSGGDQTVGNDLLPGYRGGIGMWIDDCNAIGGRVFGLIGRNSSDTFTSDGTTTLGVPFFNTSLGIADAYLVGFDAGQLGTNTGSITVGSRLDLIGAEAYLRSALMKNATSRVDFVGGYLFARLDDQLTVGTQFTDGITNAIQNGTVISTLDTFSAENTFHGGNIGLQTEANVGRWVLSTGSKFGLGNMHQEVNVAGAYQEVPPAGATVNDTRGLFAQRSNIGNQTRDVFTFIPQIDLKLGYQLRCNLRLDVGYNFVYFSNVALAGNQIDPNIDIANILQVPAAPVARFVDDSLILHGVSLGMTMTY